VVDAAVWRGDRALHTVRLHTIATGAWDLVLEGDADPAPCTLELRFPAPAVDDAGPRWLGARVPLLRWPPGERIELGDVVLQPLPPLVQGVVVDDRGEPIAAAQVEVQQEQPQPPENQDPRQNRRREPWRGLPGLTTRTGDDGAFVVHGAMPPGALRVRADSDLHFADSVPLSSPGQIVRIQLARNGIVRGQVLLPPWLADGAVSLTMRPFDEALRREHSRTVAVSPRGGGRFQIEPLMPGRFDLLVTLRNLNQPLAMVPDVFVVPGVTEDPRLSPLDLRDALFRYRLRALDDTGQPMLLDGPIHARLVAADGSVEEAGFRWQQGRAELITAQASAELTFFGRGFEPQKQLLTPGDHDVWLRPLQPALVDVPGARSLCGPTRKVRISVILDGDTGYPASLGGVDQQSGERFGFPRWDVGRSSGAWLEESDRVAIPLMTAGRYEVILRAHAAAPAAGRTARAARAAAALPRRYARCAADPRLTAALHDVRVTRIVREPTASRRPHARPSRTSCPAVPGRLADADCGDRCPGAPALARVERPRHALHRQRLLGVLDPAAVQHCAPARSTRRRSARPGSGPMHRRCSASRCRSTRGSPASACPAPPTRRRRWRSSRASTTGRPKACRSCRSTTTCRCARTR
jgi:hypothetical protein